MNNVKIQTLKGFRDFLPKEAKKRQYVIALMKSVFESYGFEPLETPALEYEEILSGKYGEEADTLMYKFEDNGKRKVAMRYDQTVPLARIVSQYHDILPMPFKRYQIQPVWRAENTQKGRYREFVQCDIDTVGSFSSIADAEFIAITSTVFHKLGFDHFKILINDRAVFEGLTTQAITIIDKLKKIGESGVCNELIEKKLVKDMSEAENLLQSIVKQKPTQRIKEILNHLEVLEVEKSLVEFSPTLARGLDYYTGLIFEVESLNYSIGSLAGGGRYDNLVGIFTGKKIPAVGMAFGFDRIIDAMTNLDLFPAEIAHSPTKILVTIFNKEFESLSLDILAQLQSNSIASEIYLESDTKMEKQLKYADHKKIPFALIIGPEEKKHNTVTVKNLETREQQTIPLLGLFSMFES